MSDLRGTRVLRVERCHKHSRIAVIIELEMNASLGEHGALELAQGAGDFWRAGPDQSVFEDVAELQVVAFGQGQELCGARVHVGSVDATGLEETNSGGDAQASQDREGLDVLYIISKLYRQYWIWKLTAERAAPPLAPAAGVASLKSKTVSFLNASPVSRLSPETRSLWKRLIAVGAVKRSRKRAKLSAGGAGVGVALGWAAWGFGRAWTEATAASPVRI